MAVVSYFVIPEDKWLDRRGIAHVIDAVEGKIGTEKVGEEKVGEEEQVEGEGETEKDK